MARGVLLARAEHCIKHQAQVAHPEGVQHVAGPTRLVWVVADLSTFLAAVQRLDGGVHVQHPRPLQGLAHAEHQCVAHPRLAGLGRHRLERTAYRVFADHAVQAQSLGSHRIAAHASNVRVTLASRQDAQHQRAQHVAWPRCVGAAVVQRARLHPAIEHTGRSQKLGEEHDLPVWRRLCLVVPTHVHASTQRVDHHRVFASLRQHGLLRFVRFTHQVSLPNSLNPSPALKKSAKTQTQLRFLG